MGVKNEQAERIEALRTLIERLSHPDLTLTEAKGLRSECLDLLESGHSTAGGGVAAPMPALHPIGFTGLRRSRIRPTAPLDSVV